MHSNISVYALKLLRELLLTVYEINQRPISNTFFVWKKIKTTICKWIDKAKVRQLQQVSRIDKSYFESIYTLRHLSNYA